MQVADESPILAYAAPKNYPPRLTATTPFDFTNSTPVHAPIDKYGNQPVDRNLDEFQTASDTTS